MFNLFKGKTEISKTNKKLPMPNVKSSKITLKNYILRIMFKSGRYQEYGIKATIFPHVYRKILNWHLFRESENYQFNFEDGVVTFSRNDIEYIKVNKQNGQ